MDILNVKPHDEKLPRPGAGTIVIYETDDGPFMIKGLKFTNEWKISVGGAVDPGETFFDAAKREFFEETFYLGCKYVLEPFAVHENRKEDMTYITVGAVSTSYIKTRTDLDDFVKYLNEKADLLYPYGNHYFALLNGKPAPEKPARDKADLVISEVTDRFLELKPLTLEIIKGTKKWNELTELAKKKTFEDIAKYTEFSKFEVVPLSTVMDIYPQVTKEKTTFEGYGKVFRHEKDSMLHVLQAYNSRTQDQDERIN